MRECNLAPRSLLTRDECPGCHSIFVSGYDPSGVRSCPSCKQKFIPKPPNTGGANNVYHSDGCPAIMSDGRFITNYNSSNELTESMRRLNGIDNPNAFRMFMQTNGDKFMQAERANAIQSNTCQPATACSEGWLKLQTTNGCNWANFNQ